ncbi:MAG: hypothetical protein ACKV2Q_31390 [Planctomycetaceae bacterium]
MSESFPDFLQGVRPTPPDDVPDPNGEPVSLLRDEDTRDKLVAGGLTALAGGVGMFLVGAYMTPCVGATRSARLMREQRQQEVSAAIAQFEATQPADSSNESVTP